MATWISRPMGTPQLVEVFAFGSLTAWTCRPGRNGTPPRRWRVTTIGAHRGVFGPLRSLPLTVATVGGGVDG